MSNEDKNWEQVCQRPTNAKERRECHQRGFKTPMKPYLSTKTAEVHLAGVQDSKKPKGARVKWTKCAAADFPQQSEFDQWTVLQRSKQRIADRKSITCSGDAYEELKNMGRLPQEELVGIYLDNKNRILGTTVVSRGTSTETLANPVDVFRPAILSGATRIMVAHNHPSGEATPSPADVQFSARVKAVGESLGVPVLDSLVIGDGTYTSLKDIGLLR